MTTLPFTVGADATGSPVRADLAKLPHLLVAGTTGSGKTTFVHSILTELLSQHGPESLRLILIDPKRVELRAYRGLPHLIGQPVMTLEEAQLALTWAVGEMERRFGLLERADARDLDDYNEGNEPLPRIIVVVDELANLILSDRAGIEQPLVQLAAMGRAAGIHLIIATQHPSRDVLTGLLRANVPARAAFATVTPIDSRIILSTKGAEALPGKGAMLFRVGQHPQRVQGRWVSEEDIDRVVASWGAAKAPQPWAVAEEEVVNDYTYREERHRWSLRIPSIVWGGVALGAALMLGATLPVAALVGGVAWWVAR